MKQFQGRNLNTSKDQLMQLSALSKARKQIRLITCQKQVHDTVFETCFNM